MSDENLVLKNIEDHFNKANSEKFSFIYDDVNTLNEEDWNCFIKILCGNVLKKIEEILGFEIIINPNLESRYWSYDLWLLILCVNIQNDLFVQLNDNHKGDFR